MDDHSIYMIRRAAVIFAELPKAGILLDPDENGYIHYSVDNIIIPLKRSSLEKFDLVIPKKAFESSMEMIVDNLSIVPRDILDGLDYNDAAYYKDAIEHFKIDSFNKQQHIDSIKNIIKFVLSQFYYTD